MAIHRRLIRYLPRLLGILIAIVLGYFIIQFLGTKSEEPQHKKVMQQVTMISLPPPPPPPPEMQPEVQEPEEVMEKMDEAMPDEDPGPDAGNELGLDADGSAGGDGFGLLARKGGRGVIGGGYGALVVQEINALLVDDDRLRNKEYTVVLRIWISPSGTIERYKIDKKTGDESVISMITSALKQLGSISEGPPLEIPQPIRLRIKSKI
jgi:protein TonB